MKEDEKVGTVMMAFGQGRESSDAPVFKKYIGIGQFKIVAVNPSKEELEKIYSRDVEKEPDYTSVDEETQTKQIRLEFVVTTVPEKNNGIEFTTRVPFFLKEEIRTNKDKTKVQVINCYGETTWIDVESAKQGLIPTSVAGWFVGPYRPAYVGEEDLTNFLKSYMNIPNKSYKKKDGTIVYLDNMSDAEARLDNIGTYFTGNVREIKELIKIQPDNRIQLPIGIKTSDDGKQYQDVYTKMILRSNTTDYTKLGTEIEASKAAGLYSKSEFSLKPLQEYVVEATSFQPAQSTSAPKINMPTINMPGSKPVATGAPVPANGSANFGGFFGGNAGTAPSAPAAGDDLPF